MSENFSDANNLLMTKATEKLETYLESYIIQDSKTVHRFYLTLTIPEILAPM